MANKVTLEAEEYNKLVNWASMNKQNAHYLIENHIPVKLPNYFTQGDVDKILETIQMSLDYRKDAWGQFQRTRDMTMVKVGWTLAMRPSEVRQIKIDDFEHTEEGIVIHIRPETNKERKGREIPVPDKLWELILEYLSYPREYFWQGSPYLFPSLGGQFVSAPAWRHKFNKILKEAGLFNKSKICGPYGLRHGRATQLIDQGAAIFDVQRLLGHATTECTMIYTHMTTRSKRRIRDLIEQQYQNQQHQQLPL